MGFFYWEEKIIHYMLFGLFNFCDRLLDEKSGTPPNFTLKDFPPRPVVYWLSLYIISNDKSHTICCLLKRNTREIAASLISACYYWQRRIDNAPMILSNEDIQLIRRPWTGHQVKFLLYTAFHVCLGVKNLTFGKQV